MKSIHQWLSEYGQSHQNKRNKLIHWICVPAIFFSITGMLHLVKLPIQFSGIHISLAMIALFLVWLYYLKLSTSLSIGMLLFSFACLYLAQWIETSHIIPLWIFSLLIFALAWVAQFWGHHLEGKKPSFLKDIQFLLIGPAWLMSFIYQKLKIKF
ncbi:MAG: DUF962 domain-containing protein [Ferruginibacter sp.]|nr:DUF962 domain-containing protein [Ferruginibacter sp.]